MRIIEFDGVRSLRVETALYLRQKSQIAGQYFC